MTYSFKAIATALLVGSASLVGCDLVDIEDRPSPNGPSLDDVLANPTDASIRALAVGVEASSRTRLGNYLESVGVIGREYWRISTSDPRFTEDLLGKRDFTLDNNTFYLTAPWGSRYATIRNANTLLLAVDGNTSLSDEQKNGYRGFAKTWIAYQYLLNLNLTYENGIRFIEPGAELAGPVVGYDASLDRIATLLDEAAIDLEGATEPATTIDDTYSDAVNSFAEINRALASRVDLYREDWQGVVDAVGESFFDEGEDLEAGAYHIFSFGSGDISNPFYLDPQASSDALLVHPSYLEDLEEGDSRSSKAVARDSRTFDGLTSSFGVGVYSGPLAPLPIVTNGELVLNRAEAQARLGNSDEAISGINEIRAAAGLDAYEGGGDADGLIAEILQQRRYQLYAEGHRWIDVRRNGLLGTLPIDRVDDDVWEQFPIPVAENVDQNP